MIAPYYEDDAVTLYHGDCRDVLPEIAYDVAGSLVVTDPPYGVTYSSNHNIGRGTAPITNDGTRLSLALYRQVVPLLGRAHHMLWFTRWDAWPDVWTILGQHHPLRGLLVWDKGHPGMGDLNHWGLSYELIASAGTAKITGGRDGSVLRFQPVPSNGRWHPTAKPVALLAYLINKVPPSVVIDPFAGSGSTLVAARQIGRRAIGIESDERYCDATVRRLSQQALDLEPA